MEEDGVEEDGAVEDSVGAMVVSISLQLILQFTPFLLFTYIPQSMVMLMMNIQADGEVAELSSVVVLSEDDDGAEVVGEDDGPVDVDLAVDSVVDLEEDKR